VSRPAASLRVAVVGGGLGGISAAVHLAARGHRVTLYERTGMLGGKASIFEQAGYSFDTGPSLLTMPETLCTAAGLDRAAELPLARLDPQCRYFFPDGQKLDLRDDRASTLRQVAAFSPGQDRSFAAALDLSESIYETVGRPFLEAPFEGMTRMARAFAGKPFAALRFGAMQGFLADVSKGASSDERLQWIIQRYATYAGGGPARTPAAFAMILHLETAGGAWYPQGGIHSIARMGGRLLEHVGVEVKLNTPVQSLVVRNGAARAVVTKGVEAPYDAIVANADPVTVARQLLSREAVEQSGLTPHLDQELGLSGAVLLLGMKGRLDHLSHHTVVFPQRYPDEFTDLFKHGRTPRDPTVYLCVPSRTDPGRAPPGCESVFCMINSPAFRDGAGPDLTPVQFTSLIKRAVERVIPDLTSRIEVEHFIGPAELQSRFQAPGGSIYGVSPHGRLSPFHRPMQRAEGLRGLYFAGGGTNPGGGIPLVLRSGLFAADLVERDLGRGRLSAPGAAL